MMHIGVQGLWHLGSVIAACVASVGHSVIGVDLNRETIDNLKQAKAPIFEPGLNDLLKEGIDKQYLSFSSDLSALKDVEVLWVAFDTPVDEDDQADLEFVFEQIKSALPHLSVGTLILISSQMPVGSIRSLEDFVREHLPHKHLQFACSPENLRLGKALDVFLKPDRIVVGIRTEEARKQLEKLLYAITDRIEWMSVEAAEMTKHAINAFLAISVTFINEISSICEQVGADAKQVERGLKTEMRIGPKAYLSPGGPFAGGTLARDLEFLNLASQNLSLKTPLLSSIRISNDEHKNWVRRKLLQKPGGLKGVTVSIWGLTYKAGTDTLRRSLAVELCDWLLEQGATPHVYDPVVQNLPAHWLNKIVHHREALDAVVDSEILVLGTEWPVLREEAKKLSTVASPNLLIIDANRYLQEMVLPLGLKYLSVGTPII